MLDKNTRFCRFDELRPPQLSAAASPPEVLSEKCQFNAHLGFSLQ